MRVCVLMGHFPAKSSFIFKISFYAKRQYISILSRADKMIYTFSSILKLLIS